MEVLFSQPRCVAIIEREVIYDVAFDHYGRRMATSSRDQLVMVWDKKHGKDDWNKSAEWKAHNDPVCKISWAHPEYGQSLATCSSDRTAAIWEELLDDSEKTGEKWVRKANLVASNSSVIDVKFAPKCLGLFIATCSSDGSIRIYKAPDVLNLSHWTLQQEVHCRKQATCISWNPNLSSECYPAQYYKLSNCNVKEQAKITEINNIYSKLPSVEESGSYIVVPQDPMLAVGFHDSSCRANDYIELIQYISRLRRWNKAQYTMTSSNYCTTFGTDPVQDLAFAPRLGRTYDLLAVATSRGIKVYAYYQLLNSSFTNFKCKLHLVSDFSGYNNSVWRISWNSLGNILVTTGNDNCIRLWKQYEMSRVDEEKLGTTLQPTNIHLPLRKYKQFCWKSVAVLKPSDLY